MIRAVVDTNVLVSILLSRSRSAPHLIRKAFEDGRMIFCLSDELFTEYVEVLHRPRIRRLLGAEQVLAVEHFLTRLEELAHWSAVPLDTRHIHLDDPDDAIVLATATATEAAVIVTGDNYLLSLGMHAGIPILSPRMFVEALERRKI